MRAVAEIAPAVSPPRHAELLDLRFRALVPEADWARLPPAVRRRFSKRLGEGESAVYVGRVVETDLSPLGWLLAQGLRLVGAPLPTTRVADVPSVVAVTQDGAGSGQIWTRLYARGSGFPQAIHSAKRFAGPTGLEEHVRCGVGMTLAVAVEERALVFRSDRYFIGPGRWRAMLPAWATPPTRAIASRVSPGMRDASANGPRVPASTTHRSTAGARAMVIASMTRPR